MISTLLALMPPQARPRVRGFLLGSLLSVVLRAVAAVLLVPLVGALFGADPSGALPWVAGVAACVVLGWILDSRIAATGFDLGFATLDHAQHDVTERLSQVSLGWFDAETTATARQSIATTGPDLVGLVVYLLTPILQAVLLPAAIGLALLPISWPLGLAALAGVPVLLGALWGSGRLSRRADRAADETNRELTERIVEFARTQQALRAARRVEPARSEVGRALAGQHGSHRRLVLMQLPGQLLFSLATQVVLVLLGGTTAWLVVRGDLDGPAAVAMIVVIVRYLEPITALSDLAPGLESTRTTLRSIGAVLDAPVPPGVSAQGVDTPGAAGTAARVELDGVTFAYGDEPVVEDLTLAFAAGETTALVGPSGSGKSTVLALVAGLRHPDSGRVLHEGRPVVDPRDVSVVFQHPYLFDGTIRDNVLAAHREASEEAVGRALALARVDVLAERLPESLGARVGEGGSTLSGGERQRVSIARALLKPSAVLLVDEATSALDTENEAAVVAAVAEDPQQRTRVVVAHRLATIAAADRVVFLEDGRVVEDGAVDELLAAGGRFAQFWRQQDEASGWRVAAGATT